jgi:hypothetical protein
MIGKLLRRIFHRQPLEIPYIIRRRPPQTEEMTNIFLTWKWHNGKWIKVCSICGSNCGQCGLVTDYM